MTSRPYHPTHRPPPGRARAAPAASTRRVVAQWALVVVAVSSTYVGITVARSGAGGSKGAPAPVVGEALQRWDEVNPDEPPHERVSGTTTIAADHQDGEGNPDPDPGTRTTTDDVEAEGRSEGDPTETTVSDPGPVDGAGHVSADSESSEPEPSEATTDAADTGTQDDRGDTVPAETSTSVATPTTVAADEDVLERRVIDVVGDELATEAEAELRVALAPGSVTFMASPGRTLAGAGDDFTIAAARGRLDAAVVVLGRHDTSTTERWVADIATAFELLANVPCVVWVDLRELTDVEVDRNELTDALASTRSNVTVAPWSALAEADGMIDTDTGTLTELGRARFAILVGASVRACFDDGEGTVVDLAGASADVLNADQSP